MFTGPGRLLSDMVLHSFLECVLACGCPEHQCEECDGCPHGCPECYGCKCDLYQMREDEAP